MKKSFFVCIVVTLCLLTFIMTTDVLATSHVKVFYDLNKSLFKRPDIQGLFPDALPIFNKLITEQFWNHGQIKSGINSPRYLWSVGMIYEGFNEDFIKLVVVDEDLITLLKSKAMFNILKNEEDMNKLIDLIKSGTLPPATLEIVSGDGQQGKPNTELSDPITVEVKDEFGNLLKGIEVTFKLKEGAGELSSSKMNTKASGRATVKFTLGSDIGINKIEVKVKGISLPKIIYAATVVENPVIYMTISPESDRYIPADMVTCSVNIANLGDVGSYQAKLQFDKSALELNDEGNYKYETIDCLPENISSNIPGEYVYIPLKGMTEKNNVLEELTFKIIKADKQSTLVLYDVILYDKDNILQEAYINNVNIVSYLRSDVDKNGVVDISDLDLLDSFIPDRVVSDQLHKADVNRDNKVNVLDIIYVANDLKDESVDTIAKSILEKKLFSITDVWKWLDDAKKLEPTILPDTEENSVYKNGINTLKMWVSELIKMQSDVNVDGDVNIHDFIEVAEVINEEEIDLTKDVDGNGKVDILDLILVAGSMGSDANVISMTIHDQNKFSQEVISGWLGQAENLAKTISDTIKSDPTYMHGLAVLKNLESLLQVSDTPEDATSEDPPPAEDVNQDGKVNILDLVIVSQNFSLSPPTDPRADVNGDGYVNILDLVAIANYEESVDASPSANVHAQEYISPETVQTWIALAQIADDGSTVFSEGIANLKQLLAVSTPQKTALHANYPNPFNPETWIPYQLAEATDVTIVIHAMNGSLVRRLSLGHQAAGMYRSKNRAAYWDGRNAFGEPVASGLYFYTLTAGNYSATHKMLIRK